MSEITVIVPCYNVENYVARCLESLVTQTVLVDIIAINDGSTDRTLDELKKFSSSNHCSRITVIDKINGGYASAVNVGISKAITPYIAICEPDDYVATDYYEYLLRHMKETNVDAVFYSGYTEKREHFQDILCESYIPREFGKVLVDDEIINRLRYGSVGITLALYNRIFLARNEIDLPESSMAYQDAPFVGKILSCCDSYSVIPGNGYYYTRGREGQSVQDASRFINIIPSIKDLLTFRMCKPSRKQAILTFSLSQLLDRLIFAGRVSRSSNSYIEIKKYILEILLSFNSNKIEIPERFKNYIQSESDLCKYIDSMSFISTFTFKRQYEELPTLNKIEPIYPIYLISLYLVYKLDKYILEVETYKTKLNTVEYDLLRFINIPNNIYSTTLKIKIKKLLTLFNCNFLINHNPKLLVCCSIILKDSISELTIPNPLFRDDAQEIYENFYNLSSVKTYKTDLISFSLDIYSQLEQNFEEFIAYIKNKSVIVVGNSPINIGKNLGKDIDNFDVVIRFNNYELSHYRDDYGNRTDVWAISPAFNSIYEKPSTNISDISFVVTFDIDKILTRNQRLTIYQFMLAGHKFVRLPSFSVLDYLNYRSPSLGILMLYFLSQNRAMLKELYATGFGLSEQSGNKIYHYFKDKVQINISHHNWAIERQFYNKLIASGKVSEL